MSSGNLVQIVYADEASYGAKPDTAAAITINTVRKVSDSLSGTPTVTESAEIRTDRMSGGQVPTGLEVGGGIEFELAPDAFFDRFFELGMMAPWAAATAPVTATFTPDVSDEQRGLIDGTGVGAGISAGDVVVLLDGTDKYVFSVIAVNSADQLDVARARGQASVSGDVTRPQYLDIGSTVDSVTLAKAYQDVLTTPGTDEKSQTYTGGLVSGFTINAAYGAIVSGSFNLNANGYEQESPSFAQQVVAGGGTINPAGTSLPLNASLDVPVVASNGQASEFCLENFTITLDNGLTPQNCIGYAAPRRYELGTAAITVEANMYLGEQSYDAFMPAKLTQNPISMLFTMINSGGGYAFHFPAIQLTFPDPAGQGQNQPVMIEASGTARVGTNGESALRIYKL